MSGVLWEQASLVPFLVITLFLGGGAAWMTGAAVARSWTHPVILVAYCALLAFAARFLHFALGGGSLLAPWFLFVDFALLALIAGVSFRATRATQMATQYFWLFEKTSPLSWREIAVKPGRSDSEVGSASDRA